MDPAYFVGNMFLEFMRFVPVLHAQCLASHRLVPLCNRSVTSCDVSAGRKAILDFINETFDLNLAKIEDTCSGAAYACCAPESLADSFFFS